MLGFGLGLGVAGQNSGLSEPPAITATSAPIMAALTDAQTPADSFTAGTYASTAGTIASQDVVYTVNGAAQAGTFTLTAGDTVRAAETVTDSASNVRVFYTSTVTVTPSIALSNTAIPAITGTATVGQTLTVSDGTWAGSAARTYAYQWTRDGADISGATANTYDLVAADDGSSVACTVTASDGFTTVAASAAGVSVTSSTAPVIYPGTVIFEPIGQSNIVGTCNIDGTLDPALQGQYDRVWLVDSAYLNNNTLPFYHTLQVVETGQTIDGVVGKVTEFGSPNGISTVFGRAVFVNDVAAGSDYLPGAKALFALKNGASGTPQSNWLPSGSGGGFNTSDAIMRNIVHDYIAANDSRISDFNYGQGEAECEDVSITAETAQGTTDPALIIPATINDPAITGFAAGLANTRRAKREYFGIDSVPYIVLGVVLPDLAVDPYAGNAERLREALTTQYRNVARWAVRLSDDMTAITVTDLGLYDRSIAYDTVTDTFTETVTGTASTLKDDNTYWIDGRGWESTDSLHHVVPAHLRMGATLKLLMEHIYGAGGNPPASHTITEVKPIFYQAMAQTTVGSNAWSFDFMPSENVTLYVSAYAAGSAKPTAAQVKAGTGAGFVATASTAGSRRTVSTGIIGGLSPSMDYDIYGVLEFGTILGAVPSPVSVTTAAAVVSPWSLVGTTTAKVEPYATLGDTVSIALPAGVAQNDIVLVAVASDLAVNSANANQGAATAGYTQEDAAYTGANPGAYFAWKRMGATPDATLDLYMGSKRQAVAVQVWRGGNVTTLMDTPVVAVAGGGASPDPAALTTVTDNALRVLVAFIDDDDATSVTAPSGYGDLVFETTSLGTNPGAAAATVAMASKDAGAAGAEDPGPFTTDVNDAWRVLHVALRPA